ANRLRSLIHKLFTFARERGADIPNPVTGIPKFREEKRKRFLMRDEAGPFFRALNAETNTTIKHFVTLALCTGIRSGNIRAGRWEQINFNASTWHLPEAKGGAYTVPLTSWALEVLRDRREMYSGDWIFPAEGWSKTGHLGDPHKAWKALTAQAGIEGLRIHDLRRTLASWMSMEGISYPVISTALGHAVGTGAITMIYARTDLETVRTAMETALAAMLRAGGVDVLHFERKSGSR
ncbi:MAG: tyrosine-type recombinase/integrase, partial [Candidatus Latescibacteria bacterium]|nr:tyrosine-type recombinase/integrase [Candidatus Latescibacterota bacterium]